jgi:hypothetical protein
VTETSSFLLFRLFLENEEKPAMKTFSLSPSDYNGAILASFRVLFPSPAVMSNSALASPSLSDPRNFSPAFVFRLPSAVYGRERSVEARSFTLKNSVPCHF